MSTTKEQLAEQDLALISLLVEKAREDKVVWTFQNNQAVGQAANVVVIVSMPSSEFLQNNRWRSVHVALGGNMITNFFYPTDQIGTSQGARFATPEITDLVDELFGILKAKYTQQTYGRALGVLKNL